MNNQELYKLWDDFLKEWPLDRVRQMLLTEYTNPNTDDAYIYWLEKRLEKLGSIWGGSAFKFGVYYRKDKEKKEPQKGKIWGETYAWAKKYGPTEQQVFQTVRERIVQVIEAVQDGNLEIIDNIDFSLALKWKIAFLYQSRENPLIFPIFKHDCLFYLYQAIDPTAKPNQTVHSLLYTSLLDQHKAKGDLLTIANVLWQEWKTAKEKKIRYFAVPLSWSLDEKEIEELCGLQHVSAENISDFLDKLLADSDIAVDDCFVLLEEDIVRAVGKLTNAEPGDFAWQQTPVNFSIDLVPIPTSEIRELESGEQKEIWSQVPETIDSKRSKPEPVTIEPEPVKSEPAKPCNPQNIILYGPPGTGKTYSTTGRALQLILGPEKIKGMSHDTRVRHFRQLQQQGRIEFITFHQAYGYEEFVEGIRPVLDDQANNEVRYELHKGVFKSIALKAAAEGIRKKAEPASFDLLWKQLLNEINNEESRVVESISGKQYLLSVTSRKNIQIHACEIDDEGNVSQKDGHVGQTASKDNVKLIWDHQQELGPDPALITHEKTLKLFSGEMGGGGGHHYTAIWIAYRELFQISSTSMRSSSRDRPSELVVQEALDKPSPGLVEFSFSNSSPQYVLIIDEINRGNISKILGELITLLEPDKRLSHAGELKLPLSYSPEHRFAVPPNLHVIGTMNTADRSIALMDVALRRRFTFEELMPDKGVIEQHLKHQGVGEHFIELVIDIFETLNSRIRFLYDQDHQLGHAYFLNAVNYESLRLIFVDRIIPLLQEYFYGAWDKICIILGCPYDENGNSLRDKPVCVDKKYIHPVIYAKKFFEEETLGFDHDEYEDRIDFEQAKDFKKSDVMPKTLIPYLIGILTFKDPEEYKTRILQLEKEIDDTQENK
jgi:5-methylcytosine-specific restriction enzyme B